MAMAIGDKFKFYIETPDGRMMEIPVIVSNFSITVPFDDVCHFEFAGISQKPPIWLLQDDWQDSIETRKSSPEWKCDYCGRPNQRADETCKSCGSVRSFVYG
jgi:hypothetical protein